MTIALLASAIALRWALGYAYPAPFIPFYPAILASTLLGGRATGYFALAVSLSCAGLFFEGIPAVRSPGDAAIALLLFALVAMTVIEILVRQNDLSDALYAGEISLLRRHDALRARQAQTTARLAELEALYEQAPVGLAFLDPEMKFVRINSALAEINGHSVEEHLGRNAWDLVPDLRKVAEPLLRKVLDSGMPVGNVDLSGKTAAHPGIERHWREFFYPVVCADGVTRGVGILCEEVTEAKRARHREELLAREVDHRAKNLLAVVQSIVQLTNTDCDSAGFKSSVLDRIMALGRVHALLSQHRWEGVFLADIVNEEMAPFRDMVDIAFLPVPLLLNPGAAQAISMVLHELLTNCVKYGALSKGGRVLLTFAQDGGVTGAVSIDWHEVGGPAVRPATVRGFGTRMIRAAVCSALEGQLDYHLAPEGLRCTIIFPTDRCRAFGTPSDE